MTFGGGAAAASPGRLPPVTLTPVAVPVAAPAGPPGPGMPDTPDPGAPEEAMMVVLEPDGVPCGEPAGEPDAALPEAVADEDPKVLEEAGLLDADPVALGFVSLLAAPVGRPTPVPALAPSPES